MKNTLTITIKILVGIFTILIPFFLVIYIAESIIYIHEYYLLKWIALFISGLGFYISGLINRKTPLKWLPFLYLSLLLFIPMRYVYFPLFLFIILFATISLFITRREYAKKYRLMSLTFMTVIFVYFLFSQPLIIRETKAISYYNDVLENSFEVWNFSKVKSYQLPEYIYFDTNNNPVDLKTFKNKTLYISFWATWCKPCMKEKPELEKLKDYYKDSTDVIFVDILLDDSEDNWLKYLDQNKPQGIQLRSRNAVKTRELFEMSGIPMHIVVNSEWLYRKERNISFAYNLLSNQEVLNNFVNRKESINNIVFKLVKISDPITKSFIEITDIDTTEYFSPQEGRIYKINELLQNFLDSTLTEKNEIEMEVPEYAYFGIEKTIYRNDSVINVGYFKTSNSVLQNLN